MSTEAVGSSTTLDSEMFLKLFVSELQHQDPLEPMSNTEYITQMAQFSSVEQAAKLASSFEDVLKLTEFNSATSLIGNRVSYIDAQSGASADGVVDGVTSEGGEVYLEVGGQKVPPSAVMSVRSA